MNPLGYSKCLEHKSIASVTWDDFTFESTNGPVVHGVAHCLVEPTCWWNVWGDSYVVLGGEDEI